CMDAVWVWEADGMADLGAYSGSTPIASPSVSNGAMVFDSDFYDNAGIQGNFGLGICASPQVAELISPVMDLTGAGALSLQFNQYFRQFNSVYKVAWSADGGNSWSDDIIFNDDVAVNQASTPNDVETVPLKGATGSSQFRIKFIIEGDYYFWIIDDVTIVLRENNNMQVNENWYAIAPNFRTPLSQVEGFGFLADIENVGGNDQTNVKLNITVKKDGNPAVVYSEDNVYGTVPSDSLWENVSFGDFTPDPVKANYTATYTLSSDSLDVDMSNNTLQFKFEITDSVFAKEKAKTRDVLPAAGNWDNGEAHSWAYGNYFYVPKGEGMIASSASFGIQNASELAGLPLQIRLYRWYDNDNDGNMGTEMDGERELVGLNDYTILGTEPNTSIRKISLFDFSFDEHPKLEDDAHYVIMVEFTAPDDMTDYVTFASEEYDYGAMVLNSAQLLKPRYAAMLGINDPLIDEVYSSLGFGWDIVPVVRLHVNEAPNATNELNPELNKVELFPNPASNLLNVEMALEKTMEKVYLRVVNSKGQVMHQADFQNFQQDKLQIDISQFAAGNYLVFITTDAGQAVRKFAVQR
ncbi:MAG: T9SS type A sorting domain-containing protein, partial [Bacteroidota bacterium]